MTDAELRALVRSIKSSITYCAPEALESLLYDKLHFVAASLIGWRLRVEELEVRVTELEDEIASYQLGEVIDER